MEEVDERKRLKTKQSKKKPRSVNRDQLKTDIPRPLPSTNKENGKGLLKNYRTCVHNKHKVGCSFYA